MGTAPVFLAVSCLAEVVGRLRVRAGWGGALGRGGGGGLALFDAGSGLLGRLLLRLFGGGGHGLLFLGCLLVFVGHGCLLTGIGSKGSRPA